MDIQAVRLAMIFLDAYFNDILPEDVVGDFRAWIAGKYQSEEKIEAMYQLWAKGTELDKETDPDAMKSFEEVVRKLNFPKAFEEEFLKMRNDIPLLQAREEILPCDIEEISAAERQPAEKRGGIVLPLRRTVLTRVAAAVALICVAGAAYYFITRPHGVEPQIAMIAMAVPDTLGAQGRATLQDGSDIWIKPGSTISYAKDFGAGEKRRLMLNSGEVYLNVASDSTKQFMVETPHLNVNVLGTRFDVEAEPDSRQTVVTLYQGRITIDGIKGDGVAEIPMSPGRRLVYDNATGVYRIENTAATLPEWIAARLTFEEATYANIFRTLEWYYGITVEVDGEFRYDGDLNFRFTGKENLEQAMYEFQNFSREFTYEISGRTVKVKVQD